MTSLQGIQCAFIFSPPSPTVVLSNRLITSKETIRRSTTENSEGVNADKCYWETAHALGIHDHSLKKTVSPPTCGKLLSHCCDRVDTFRSKIGLRLCIFKLGVTACPVTRWQLYKEQGYQVMWILATSDSIDLVHMCEAALIRIFHLHIGCRNRAGSGGDGRLNCQPPPPPPYYVYIVGGRADEGKWTG